MPELPEVEIIRRHLDAELRERTIRNARIRRRDLVLNLPTARALASKLEDRRIRRVDRRGKNLLFRLDNEAVLQTQIRMTGRFALGYERPDPSLYRHIMAVFELDDGRSLYYDDVRRLGGFRWLEPDEWAALDRSLGPEPLAPGFTARRLGTLLEGTRAPIKNALLDQKRIAGIGNIYASEALFGARIHPERAGCSLEAGEIAALHRSIRAVLRDALHAAGTTFSDFRAVNGRSGRYQHSLSVYGREGEPCRSCGRPVERSVQAGRSTFLCASCQT